MMLDKNKVKLGIAPIAWTNDDLPELGGQNTFAQCVSEMALAGFAGCEIGNKYPRNAAVLKEELELRNLSICNSWFSTFFTTKAEEETISAFREQLLFLHELGAKVIGCSEQGGSIQGSPVPIFGGGKPVFGDREWRRLTAGMDKLAEIAAEKDMRVCLHHHMGTGIQTPAEIDRFMAETGEAVGLLFDSGHIYFSEGTQEAVDKLIDKYIRRVFHVHLKDVRSARRKTVKAGDLSFLDAVRIGTFTVPGDGDISFAHIFEALERNDYRGWLVVEAEQDPAMADPLKYALMARGFIRENTGL